MQQRCRFQKQPQTFQFIGRAAAPRTKNAPQLRHRFCLRALLRLHTKDKLASVIDAQANPVSVGQYPLPDELAVDENAVQLTAIFDKQPARSIANGRALPRDTQIIERQVVAGLRAASDKEREFVDRNRPPGTIREHHLNVSIHWNRRFSHREQASEF